MLPPINDGQMDVKKNNNNINKKKTECINYNDPSVVKEIRIIWQN